MCRVWWRRTPGMDAECHRLAVGAVEATSLAGGDEALGRQTCGPETAFGGTACQGLGGPEDTGG